MTPTPPSPAFYRLQLPHDAYTRAAAHTTGARRHFTIVQAPTLV